MLVTMKVKIYRNKNFSGVISDTSSKPQRERREMTSFDKERV